jgi:hypothetical protein
MNANDTTTETPASPWHLHPGHVRAIDLALAGDDGGALDALRRAIDADPDDHKSRGFAAALLGRLGRWREFWPAIEWRWKSPTAQPNVFADWPEWRGEPLDGRTIVVWLEQGDGDCILFARYLPELKRRGARRVIVFPHRHGLERLLAAVPGVDRVGSIDDLNFCQCPIASLPLRLEMLDPTWPGPYLSAAASPKRFELPGGGLRVGVRWAGSPVFPGDHLRSRRLAEFAPVANVPGVTLYSLQKGTGSEQAAAAPFPIVDRMGECDDYADTAALIAGLDLVITTCTSRSATKPIRRRRLASTASARWCSTCGARS